MKCIQRLVLGVLLALSWTHAGQAGSGTTVLPYLTSPEGARAVALSGATGSLADGAYSLFANPAALGAIESSQVSFSHQIGIAETSSEILGLALPVGKTMTLGLGVISRGQKDIDNGVDGEAPWSVGDLAIDFAAGMTLSENTRLGGGLKWIRSTLGPYTASTVAVDLGVQVKTSRSLTLGVALQNFGTGLKYINYMAALPSLLKASAGLTLELAPKQSLIEALDLNYGINDSVFQAQLGVEYNYAETGFLRLGYSLGEESVNGITAGGGIRLVFSGLQARLDYAFAPKLWNGWSQTEAEHTLTLSLAF